MVLCCLFVCYKDYCLFLIVVYINICCIYIICWLFLVCYYNEINSYCCNSFYINIIGLGLDFNL